MSAATGTAPALWCERTLVGGRVESGVRVRVGPDGTVAHVEVGALPSPGDEQLHGVVQPGAVNAHSHAFHRALRGRTHDGGGSFWTWRELMYAEAARLDAESYEQLATAVYAEMVTTGWTAVGEFHYLHHPGHHLGRGAPAPRGSAAAQPHAVELALARAAERAGIRLVLLDTCYLAGGFGRPLGDVQQRFGDGDAAGWAARHRDLRDALAELAPTALLGAALHSVRAVPVDQLDVLAAALDSYAPVHVHLSEQPAENEDCLVHTGLTPTALLARHGLLGPRLSAVHATHLSAADIELLGAAEVSVVACPTTEADLADGTGPFTELVAAGAVLALGSDQHAVVDPLLEARALEHGERLRSGRRGRFSPAALRAALSAGGSRSLGLPAPEIAPGAPCDLVAVDDSSVRTAGSAPDQLVLTATASDVTAVVVRGRVVARDGVHALLGDPADLLAEALTARTGTATAGRAS